MFGIKPKKEVKEPKEKRTMMTVKKHEEIITDLNKANVYTIKELKQNQELEILELKQMQEMALKEKDFQIKHFKDEEVLKFKKERDEALTKQAVLEKENKMLHDIVDLNADIIDIKDLVKKLIEKLPSVDLRSITVQQLGGGK